MAAWHFHEKLIFFPSAVLSATPKALHLPYEDMHITTADGTILHGWYVPASEGVLFDRNFTILLFHGNAGNISHRLDYIRIFNELGCNSLIIDYHGYGLSGGKPSVKGTEEDALAAWNRLIAEKGAAPERIVLHGHSFTLVAAGGDEKLADKALGSGTGYHPVYGDIPHSA
ncbi:MAG: alpha/beta hydrolase [Desulfovibrionaceae bacterium]|nr:alpha/beta hydrolase [Desulfovibrionaceae bacterium]